MRVLRTIALSACLGALLLGQSQAPQPQAQPEPQGLVASLLAKAKSLLGTPYHSGGTTPKGFDCSGFVRFVFGTFGLGLERSSYSQATQGKAVDLKQIQPGDLLFFKTRGKSDRISHVGIYLGQGQFIHAGSRGEPSNRVVRIGKLDESYYAQRLVSARRVLTQPMGAAEVLEQFLPEKLLGQDAEAGQ
ncbi:MAG TPA: C40 family peptidase [Holophaga sp.]|nr:C40 family peptidase [Holophaga sp.]